MYLRVFKIHYKMDVTVQKNFRFIQNVSVLPLNKWSGELWSITWMLIRSDATVPPTK